MGVPPLAFSMQGKCATGKDTSYMTNRLRDYSAIFLSKTSVICAYPTNKLYA